MSVSHRVHIHGPTRAGKTIILATLYKHLCQLSPRPLSAKVTLPIRRQLERLEAGLTPQHTSPGRGEAAETLSVVWGTDEYVITSHAGESYTQGEAARDLEHGVYVAAVNPFVQRKKVAARALKDFIATVQAELHPLPTFSWALEAALGALFHFTTDALGRYADGDSGTKDPSLRAALDSLKLASTARLVLKREAVKKSTRYEFGGLTESDGKAALAGLDKIAEWITLRGRDVYDRQKNLVKEARRPIVVLTHTDLLRLTPTVNAQDLVGVCWDFLSHGLSEAPCRFPYSDQVILGRNLSLLIDPPLKPDQGPKMVVRRVEASAASQIFSTVRRLVGATTPTPRGTAV